MEAEHPDLWYFAIASMMNPVSLSAREIVPIESKPSEIIDYKLRFVGRAGMAEASYSVGSSFHGVVHKLTAADMQKLDSIESAYDRKPANILLYSGERVDGWVYSNKEGFSGLPKGNEDGLPSQRYIEIMVEGCKYFGIKKAYIDQLQSIKCVPRPSPADFATFQVPSDVPTWTMVDVSAGNGNGDNPIYFSLNGKVIEYIGSRDGFVGSMIVNRFAGRSVDLAHARMLYDPKYGLPETLEAITREHAAYRESVIYNFLYPKGGEECTKVVALINQAYAD